MPYCQNYYNKGILENNKLLTFLICAKVNKNIREKNTTKKKKTIYNMDKNNSECLLSN